jgi:hypothetical protein
VAFLLFLPFPIPFLLWGKPQEGYEFTATGIAPVLHRTSLLIPAMRHGNRLQVQKWGILQQKEKFLSSHIKSFIMPAGAADLKKNLISYWEQLNGDQQEGVIDYIKYLLEEKHSISLTQYNKELEEGRTAIKMGQFVSQEELEREAKAW